MKLAVIIRSENSAHILRSIDAYRSYYEDTEKLVAEIIIFSDTFSNDDYIVLPSDSTIEDVEFCMHNIKKYKIVYAEDDTVLPISCILGKKSALLPIIICIHVCCINNWKEVFANLIFTIKDSGLYDFVTSINCVVLGTDIDYSIFEDPKIKIWYTDTNIKLFEKKTLNILHKYCENEDCYILYLHTKGVSQKNKELKGIKYWVEFMLYYNVYHFMNCIQLLNEGQDSVGCMYMKIPIGKFYAGNFWWSKSSHIRNLDLITSDEYLAPEFWILSKECKCVCMNKGYYDGYNRIYEKYNYENKLNLRYINS